MEISGIHSHDNARLSPISDTAYHVDQRLGGLCPFGAGIAFRVHGMYADVILHHLRHEPVDRAACGRDELHDVFAANFQFQRALDPFDLFPMRRTRFRSFDFSRIIWDM